MVVDDEFPVRLRAAAVGDDAVVREARLPAVARVALGRPPDLRQVAARVVRVAEGDTCDDERLDTRTASPKAP